MRHNSPRRWTRWRVSLAAPVLAAPSVNRLAGLRKRSTATSELPGPDGIRHGLVARVRAEIAAGTYDSEEKWLAAEEALLARIEARI
jgi:hypothetical protein